MNRRVVLPMFAATLFVLTGCRMYGTKQDFDLTVPWKDYQRIVVRSRNGSVALSKADLAEIRIRGTKHASGFTLSEAQEKLERVVIVAEPDPADRSVLVVKLRYPVLLSNEGVGASFEIQVPAPCAADIQTENGRVAVSGLKDAIVLKTSNGEVTIDSVAGQVRARTSNARIVAENVTGDLTVVTSNGEISAKAIRGNCELTTSNGSVHAEEVYGSVEATLSNGSIGLDVTPPKDGSVVLRTRNGSIHVTLPADLKADLDLRTNNGVVQTMLEDVPLRVQLWSQNRVKARMNGGGGVRVVATTSSGLITLESR